MGLRWRLPRYRVRIGMSRGEARRALAVWVPPAEGAQPLHTPTFNPYAGLYGVWPWFAPSAFGNIGPGVVGDGVGYLRGILFWKANQPCRPAPNPGPHVFTTGTGNCVMSFKAFFGIPGAGSPVVDQATWVAIQWCANNLPNRVL